MEIILVRHGEPEEGIDPPLTQKGWRQACQTAKRLQQMHTDRVVTSLMRRAVETCKAYLQKTQVPVEFDAGFVESEGLGKHYASPEKWFRNSPERLQRFLTDPFGVMKVDFRQFRQRVRNSLRNIQKTSKFGQRIAIFTHGMVINTILCEAVGLDSSSIRFATTHASLSRLMVSQSGKVVIMSVNDMGHLVEDGQFISQNPSQNKQQVANASTNSR